MKINLSHEVLKKELKSYFIIFIISLIFGYLTCRGCFITFESSLKNAFFSFLAWAFLWKGNEYLADYLNRKISWLHQTLLRSVVGTLVVIIYTVLILLLIQYTFYLVGYSATKVAPLEAFLFSIGITVFISLVFHSAAFLKMWRKSELLNEKLKNERLSSQYEALKSQVNPHFLFNSLNALTTLVYEDQDQATQFIQKLSKVYRYVLEHRDRETVSLETELNFVKSYIFLQKIRYGENLRFTLTISEGLNFNVAPLSIQMLIENAIKHNIISNDDPLEITISTDVDDYLVINNNLQEKNIINEVSGIGLENIKARYLFFTNRPVIIDNNGKEFIVKLPLISQKESLKAGELIKF